MSPWQICGYFLLSFLTIGTGIYPWGKNEGMDISKGVTLFFYPYSVVDIMTMRTGSAVLIPVLIPA
jgi:hypothetical protein